MKVEIGRTGNNGGKTMQIGVDGWAKASAIVRAYIEQFDLGAGCGSQLEAFTGGNVFENGKQIGRISYNGRAWDLNNQSIAA